MTIRKSMIEIYKREAKPAKIETIANDLNIELAIIEKELNNSPALTTFEGLKPDQALEIIHFYGSGVVFDKDLEKTVIDFFKGATRLKSIEEKSLNKS